MRVMIVSFAAIAFLLFATPATARHPKCLRDSMGQSFCAKWPRGVAVKNTLGEVLCAPGDCVLMEDLNPVWQCSSVSGGWARMLISGPKCEGGCVTPRVTDCDPLR